MKTVHSMRKTIRARILLQTARWLGAATIGLFLAGTALLAPPQAHAVPIVLDTSNPLANFTQDGTQTWVPGPTAITLNDASLGDFIYFFASFPDAAPGISIDLIATFRIVLSTPIGADAGASFVISDGAGKSLHASAIIKDAMRGIGLLSHGSPTDQSSYPVFLPVDWQAGPIDLHLRRTAGGGWADRGNQWHNPERARDFA